MTFLLKGKHVWQRPSLTSEVLTPLRIVWFYSQTKRHLLCSKSPALDLPRSYSGSAQSFLPPLLDLALPVSFLSGPKSEFTGGWLHKGRFLNQWKPCCVCYPQSFLWMPSEPKIEQQHYTINRPRLRDETNKCYEQCSTFLTQTETQWFIPPNGAHLG